MEPMDRGHMDALDMPEKSTMPLLESIPVDSADKVSVF
jgi:hypothetical protein